MAVDSSKAEGWTCPICTAMVWDARLPSCKCVAMYCDACLRHWLSKHDTCPTCQSRLKLDECESIRDSRIAYSILSSIRVYCPLDRHECKWQGEYGSVTAHLRVCPYRAVACDHCSTRMYACQLDTHLVTCNRRPISCPLECGAEFVRGQFAAHAAQCPNQLIACELKCTLAVTRGDMPRHIKKVCERRPQKCLKGCDVLVTPDDRKAHSLVCTHETESCALCRESYFRGNREGHVQECPEASVQCVFCEGAYIRKKKPAHDAEQWDAHRKAMIAQAMGWKRRVEKLEKQLEWIRHCIRRHTHTPRCDHVITYTRVSGSIPPSSPSCCVCKSAYRKGFRYETRCCWTCSSCMEMTYVERQNELSALAIVAP